MNKKHIISIALLLILGFGFYTYFDYMQAKKAAIADIKQFEIEAIKEISKPKAHIGFWNKLDSKVWIKILYDNGKATHAGVAPGGGYFGGVDVGNVKIIVESYNSTAKIENLVLENEGNITFNVYKDRFEQKDCNKSK